MFTLTDIQKVGLSIEPVTAAGNPAPVDGIPSWESSNPAVLVVTPSDDGLSAEAVTTGQLGNAQITVKADADLGSGVEEITGILDTEVIASQAASVGIKAGEPTSRV